MTQPYRVNLPKTIVKMRNEMKNVYIIMARKVKNAVFPKEFIWKSFKYVVAYVLVRWRVYTTKRIMGWGGHKSEAACC